MKKNEKRVYRNTKLNVGVGKGERYNNNYEQDGQKVGARLRGKAKLWNTDCVAVYI